MKEKMTWPEITSDTPFDEIRTIHERIWDYVIETGVKPNTPYRSNCALCEYVFKQEIKNVETCARYCDYCPAIWDQLDKTTCCYDMCSPYSEWFPSNHPFYDAEICKQAAIKVRNIPFKKEAIS